MDIYIYIITSSCECEWLFCFDNILTILFNWNAIRTAQDTYVLIISNRVSKKIRPRFPQKWENRQAGPPLRSKNGPLTPLGRSPDAFGSRYCQPLVVASNSVFHRFSESAFSNFRQVLSGMAFIGIFTVLKIPRGFTGYGTIPWSRCKWKIPFPSKLLPKNCSWSRSRPVEKNEIPIPCKLVPRNLGKPRDFWALSRIILWNLIFPQLRPNLCRGFVIPRYLSRDFWFNGIFCLGQQSDLLTWKAGSRAFELCLQPSFSLCSTFSIPIFNVENYY